MEWSAHTMRNSWHNICAHEPSHLGGKCCSWTDSMKCCQRTAIRMEIRAKSSKHSGSLRSSLVNLIYFFRMTLARFLFTHPYPSPCLTGMIWFMRNLALSEILRCEFHILTLRFVELPRRPEHVEKVKQNSKFTPSTMESHVVSSHGMSAPWSLSAATRHGKGSGCPWAVPYEFRQDDCEDRLCRWVPWVVITSMHFDVGSERDHWKEELVSQFGQGLGHSILVGRPVWLEESSE